MTGKTYAALMFWLLVFSGASVGIILAFDITTWWVGLVLGALSIVASHLVVYRRLL